MTKATLHSLERNRYDENTETFCRALRRHTPDGFLVHANPEQSNVRVRASSDILAGKDAAITVG